MYGIPHMELFKFSATAIALAFIGAQACHAQYCPMNGLEDAVEAELQRLRKEGLPKP